MTIFVAAVDEGSLAGAARRLHHSAASITRTISSLEDRLGARLVHRGPRSLKLTEIGATYLEACRRILAELEAADREAQEQVSTLRGLITVAAPPIFGRALVRPIIDHFLDQHPDLQASLVLVDRTVNLVEEAIDVDFRVGVLPDSSLVATHLGNLRWVICASPAYVAAHGSPAEPADLHRHRCISAHDAMGGERWRFAGPASPGVEQEVVIVPRLSVVGQGPAIESAIDGYGITRVMEIGARKPIESGQLRALLTEFQPACVPVHALATRTRLSTTKVRTFMTFAVAALRQELAQVGEAIDRILRAT